MRSRGTAKGPFILAIDIGSSSVKAALYDDQARLVSNTEARQTHRFHAASDGAAEELAEHLVERVESIIDTTLERAGDAAASIAGVAMATMASTVMGVGLDDLPVTPIYTYADTRAWRQAEELRHQLDEATIYQRTGCPLHFAYLPARLRWLQQTCPETVQRVARWTDVGAFLYSRWFGRANIPTSYCVASWMGLLDRYRLRWDEELLEYLEVPLGRLPPLADYTASVQGLTAPFAQRWPSLKSVPFFLVVGDGAAAHIGSGCAAPNRVSLTVGTSSAVRVLLDQQAPKVPPGLWAYRLGRDSTLLGGAFSEGGNLFAWATGNLKLPTERKLEEALQTLLPDGHGLTVLPFLAGERSLGWSVHARGTIDGITMATTPVHIFQALLEAVAYRLASAAKLLAPFVVQDSQIVASGGAISDSPYWLQVMADVLQRPVAVSAEGEATSRGAAILALRALGVWPALGTVPARVGRVFQPDPQRARVYQEAMERQHDLYDRLFGHEVEIAQRLIEKERA